MPTFVRSFFRRGETQGRSIAVVIYAVGGVIALLYGQDTIALIGLIGFVHEMNQIEIAALRREIRAKKMWHGGEQ